MAGSKPVVRPNLSKDLAGSRARGPAGGGTTRTRFGMDAKPMIDCVGECFATVGRWLS